jgi:glyoxylase-like metal-dependent hydrolase (beta-lactamase superfamily II)
MKRLLLLVAVAAGFGGAAADAGRSFVDPGLGSGLFVWTDTCNVYVLRDGDAALLVDSGDGSVIDHLGEIGVTRVEWVLFTHHHRDQCQGAPRLRGTGARVGAPAAERALFERPADFRKMNVLLGDAFTVHGASDVRPPIQPIPLDRTFTTNEIFRWRGHELLCLGTPGNSPGGMTYLLEHAGRTLAFSGDVMLDGARMHTWFDTEWDYGFGAGLRALRQSVAHLVRQAPDALLPSHGPIVGRPEAQWTRYEKKLATLERLHLRGYGVEGASAAYQDKVSMPTAVSHVVQVLPHVFKFKRRNFWPNFGLILADSGRALVVDCGLLEEKFLDRALDGMRVQYGLKAIDAIIVTHMHGDHFLEAPHLRAQWGAPIWALENTVDKMEHPERFDYAAPIQAYGKKHPDGSPMTGVPVDRALKPGETFEWEGYRRWAYDMRRAFRALSSQPDYRYGFDPFSVRAEPYRVTLHPGDHDEIKLHVRNFLRGQQRSRIEVHTPPGLIAEPTVIETGLAGESRQAFALRIQAAPDATPGIQLAAFDVTLDGQRVGEWFDLVVDVGADPRPPK